MSYDKDYTPGSQTFELSQSHEYHSSPTVATPEEYQRHFAMQPHMTTEIPHGLPHAPSTYPESVRMYAAPRYVDPAQQEGLPYAQLHSQDIVSAEQPQYSTQPIYGASHPPPPAQTLPSAPADSPWMNGGNVSHLSDVLGVLKIDHTAVGE